MKKVREFATGWGDAYPMTWSERTEEDLVGAAKSGHLLIPCFRPFDFLSAPNKPVRFLDSVSNRLAIEAPRGTQQHFHRNVDFDELFFQWAGETSYETEFGMVKAKPAELMLIPSGVAHRATGSADSLRLSVQLRDPLDVLLTEKDHNGETEYTVRWVGGPDWPVPAERAPTKGRVMESMHTWSDEAGDETLIEREYEPMVGVSSDGRVIQKIRLFDIFKEITGRRGPGPVSMKNDRFVAECYNTTGAQFAFHRGNRNEEFQFQFFGTADNICEFGTEKMGAGDLFIVRRGIAHRVIGSRDFRRLVLYSADPWKLQIDPTKPVRQSRFEVTEKVIDKASWRAELETA
jgi:oxalate decarboxylase/phosphoglucose isomerase-like protein (cupin superfamily)